MANFNWNEETKQRLRHLWNDGLPVSEIARRLGTSTNSVVGKAHRLNLPARPSPIRRTVDSSGQVVRKAAAPLRTEQKQAASAVLGVIPRHVPEPAVTQRWRNKPCCWPIGMPGNASFHFCNDVTIPGKPYCPAHDAMAYVRRVAAE